jgi:hypothetical protein
MKRDRSAFALIGERYLDTQHDASYIRELEAELAARGIVGLRRAIYKYIAAGALWWNFLWLDWVGLDERDVRIGWLTNAVVFGVIALLTGCFIGLTAAIVSVVVLHGLTLGLGLAGRAGTLPSPEGSHDNVP